MCRTVFFYDAPLENIANPQVTPLDTKAPWYFWWLQGMLKFGDKSLMGIILPTVLSSASLFLLSRISIAIRTAWLMGNVLSPWLLVCCWVG